MQACLILVALRWKTEFMQKLALETEEEDFRTPNASRSFSKTSPKRIAPQPLRPSDNIFETISS